METKTVNKCLNFVDEVLMDGINDVSTIGKIEFIHNLLIENGGDNTEILSCINLIIEAFSSNVSRIRSLCKLMSCYYV